MPCNSCANSCYNRNWSSNDCGNRYEPWNDDNCSSMAQDYEPPYGNMDYHTPTQSYSQHMYSGPHASHVTPHPGPSQPPYAGGYGSPYMPPNTYPMFNGRCGYCDDCLNGRPCRTEMYWGAPQTQYAYFRPGMDMGYYNNPYIGGCGDMYNPRCPTPVYPPPCFRPPPPPCRGGPY